MNDLTGVLLLNLGTPAEPSAKAVGKYLRQFLNDRRVIQLPGLFRWLLVNLLIVPFRAKQSAHAYKQIWLHNGSPLLINSLAIRDKLAVELGDNYFVTLGMTYGEPNIASAVKKLQDANVTEIIIVPLFPQYASSASGAALEQALKLLASADVIPKLRVVTEFFQDTDYIHSLAQSVQPYISEPYDYVLMSYHGLPEQQMIHNSTTACDVQIEAKEINFENHNCYRAQCYQTSRLLAQALNLAEDKWSVAFQSRLGRLPWIQPFTDEVLQQLSVKGVKNLVICCPSFVADCLETLEEIDIRARKQWLELGGTELRLVPCLNATPQWISTLAKIIRD